jgi:hypothetical protein
LLGVFPFVERGREVGVKDVGKRREEGRGAEQYLGVDAMKQVEVWDIPDDSNVVAI